MEDQEQLTRKQRKALRKQEKLEQQHVAEKSEKQRRTTLWLLAGILVIGVVGVLMLATGGDDSAAVLSETDVASDWVKGNPDAEIVIVEYSDFQCPACRSAEPVVEGLLEDYADQIRFEYRHYPLLSIHPNAMTAARASEAAGNQDKFWEMHDLLFDRQRDWSNDKTPKSTFASYAEELGLDVTRFEEDLDSGTTRDRVNEDLRAAQELNLSGTPSFFINGEQVRLQTFSDLETRVQELLESAS